LINKTMNFYGSCPILWTQKPGVEVFTTVYSLCNL
jgi:hypothetical protein